MDLLEREQHLAQLDEHLRHAAGAGRMVFVGGEAGVGKTSLVEAFCQRAQHAAQVHWKSCDTISTPGPLGSLRDVIAALGLSITPTSAGVADLDQVFRATLASLSTPGKVSILVGEDAHWADGTTLGLLRFLARRIESVPALVLVTYRDDELGPRHPLRLLLGDTASSHAVSRLPILPLSGAAVARLATGAGQDPGALHHLTGGNPFFLTEILATAGDVIPASVEDAVLARAARLSPEARRTLDAAAVIATQIYPDLLETVAGPSTEHLEEGLACGLLRTTNDHLVFRHELTRRTLMMAISPPRRRHLHAQILAALEQEPTAERDLALMAHHAEAADNRVAALELATAAAEHAQALHAHREAAAQYARALRFAAALPATARARLLEARSIACYFSEQGDEAIAARQAALSLWRELGDQRKEGENLRWLSRLQWLAGDGAAAATSGRNAITVLENLPPGPELAMAYSNFAQLCMLAQDLEGTLHWGQRAISLGEILGETETLIHALANVGTAQQNAGLATGEALVWRSLEMAQAGGHCDHACRALINLAWGALVRMDLAGTAARLTTAIAFATDHDLDTYRRYLLATRTILLLHTGEWDAALHESAALLAQPTLPLNARLLALTTRGLILARRGEAEAGALLDEALTLASRTGELLRLVPVRMARAEAALLAGDTARAAVEARAVSQFTAERGDRWQRGEVAWRLTQAGEQGIPGADLAHPYALLMAGDFAGAAAAWRALGFPYDAALAALQTSDLTLVHEAVSYLEDLGAQSVLAWALHALRARGVPYRPVLRRGPNRDTRTNPAGLTRRELDVLHLVITGRRNAEIATQLFLTPKTVGHHISAIYAKLGVSNRAEAVRAAARLGVTGA
ncbi:MAG: LuxR C-terminal-related transcriptional regulator [Chloroflexota bacterium]|nr:LuxR C-terminal-related transcriptional regulator [Chloroflexota bacterium]